MNKFFGMRFLWLSLTLSLLACREDTNCDSDYRESVKVEFKTLKVNEEIPTQIDTVNFTASFDSIYIKEYPDYQFDKISNITEIDLPARESVEGLTYVFINKKNGHKFTRELTLDYNQSQQFISEFCGIEFRYDIKTLDESGFLRIVLKDRELFYPKTNLWVFDTICTTDFTAEIDLQFRKITVDAENPDETKAVPVSKSFDRIYIEEEPEIQILEGNKSISSITLPVFPDHNQLTYVFQLEGQDDQKLVVDYTVEDFKISDYCGKTISYSISGVEITNFHQINLLKSALKKNTRNIYLLYDATGE